MKSSFVGFLAFAVTLSTAAMAQPIDPFSPFSPYSRLIEGAKSIARGETGQQAPFSPDEIAQLPTELASLEKSTKGWRLIHLYQDESPDPTNYEYRLAALRVLEGLDYGLRDCIVAPASPIAYTAVQETVTRNGFGTVVSTDRFEVERSITVSDAFVPFVMSMLQEVEGVSPSLSVIPMAVVSLGSSRGCDGPHFQNLMGKVAIIARAPDIYGGMISELPSLDSGRENWRPFVVNCVYGLHEQDFRPYIVEKCVCREELFSRYGDQDLYWKVADGYLEIDPDIDVLNKVERFSESQSDLCVFDGTTYSMPPEVEKRFQEISSNM